MGYRPEFRYVKSSLLQGVAYDCETQELTVEFKNGTRWAYEGVPDEVYEDLLGGGSAGSFFLSDVRDNYKSRRV